MASRDDWFVGSVIPGVLYDVSIPALVAFAIVTQLASIPLLFATIRVETGTQS